MSVTIDESQRASAGVRGNARMTGSAGAVIFALLAAEGITILRVQSLISAHVFIGMLVIPLVALKTATTGHRIWRYYTGAEAYTRKGPPPLILRLLGPGVVALTVAVVGTGVGLVVVGPGHGWMLLAHKASFVLWFGAMTVHVLGHILETPELALADWRSQSRAETPGAAVRISVLLLTIGVGLVLATLSLSWIGAWRHAGGG